MSQEQGRARRLHGPGQRRSPDTALQQRWPGRGDAGAEQGADALAAEIVGARGSTCDVGDEALVKACFRRDGSRSLWPAGIPAALVIADGTVDRATTRLRMPDKPDEVFIDPAGDEHQPQPTISQKDY
ncbi:MAG: hypothetical protein ACRYG8_30225 [Janthinobacterium lividum]